MRIAIVEDEPPVARRLARALRRILPDRADGADGADVIEDLRILPTLAAALEQVRSEPLDLVFLDLDLHGRSGFELLAEASAARFQTIVVSAHDEQAIRAFDHGVVDFVTKPWTDERLQLAVERALGRATAPRSAARLAVRIAGRVELVELERVLAIRGADDYAELVLDDQSTRLSEKTLAGLERVLPARFLRVHRSWIVNLDRVTSWGTAPGGRANLDVGGATVPIGRSYRRLALARLSSRAAF
jgi:two-component system response regulator LytT